MTCIMMGRPATSTMGFGIRTVSSASLEPRPPARSTVFIYGSPIDATSSKAVSGYTSGPSKRRSAGDVSAVGYFARHAPRLRLDKKYVRLEGRSVGKEGVGT